MSDTIFDPIRRKLLKKTPEEVVRQSFVHYLVHEKGFPRTSITVEKALRTLPFIKQNEGSIPNRRLDILCFDLEKGTPLLVVECKEGSITSKDLQQVHGYNTFIKAPFIALVGDKSLFFSYFNSKKGEYDYIDWIPHYNELKQKKICLVPPL